MLNRKLSKLFITLMITIISSQIVFTPISIVYAQPIKDQEDLSPMELPTMKNYLAMGKSDPQFFFTKSRMQGTIEKLIEVTFFSDQEVSSVRVGFPEEAEIVKEKLPSGFSIEQVEQSHEWIIQTESIQHTFVLPIIFGSAGSYEVTVEKATVTIEINEQEKIADENSEKEVDQTDESVENQEDSNLKEEIDRAQVSEQVTEENQSEYVVENSQDQQVNEESRDNKSVFVEQEIFNEEIAKVFTMQEFREAVSDPKIGIISVEADLTENAANIMTVNRPLLIQGNGYTLTFGNNGLYFQLDEVIRESSFRIENVTITKIGITPLINSTVESSAKWTVELEDITEVNANTMRLASIPEGKIAFTGGKSDFTRTNSSTIFIEAKEIFAINQAQINIGRGNATIFFSSATVANPKLEVENGSKITITTTAGTANTIDLRGEKSGIAIRTAGQLIVNTIGPSTTTTPTDITNNTIALTGVSPKIEINENGKLVVNSTLSKRGIHLAGNDAALVVNSSELTAISSTQTAVNISGDRPLLSTEKSTIQFGSTTGQRVNLVGDTPLLSMSNTEILMNASTGRGIYLQGETPQIFLDDSQLYMTDTGASQGMILNGEDATLSLTNNSELSIKSGGTGTAENIQIGNNNARPKILLDNNSLIKVSTTSGTGGASDISNNAIHVRGSEPKTQLSNSSKIKVTIESNARRGFYLNGSDAELIVKDSELDISTFTGQGVNVTGLSPKVDLESSRLEIFTTTGVNISLSGADGIFQATYTEAKIQSSAGQRINLVGNRSVFRLDSSRFSLNATTGRGIYLSGETPQILLDDSELSIVNSGAAQGVILQGIDSLLSLKNSSNVYLSSGGTGTSENIQIGNNNVPPRILLETKSTLSVVSTSGTGSPSVTANNAIHLRGGQPEFDIFDDSRVSVQINSGARRAIFMNGNEGKLQMRNSDLEIDPISGQGINFTGNSSLLSIKEGAVLKSHTGVNDSIILLGNEPTIDISGTDTKVDVSSNANSATTHTASIFMGQRTNNTSMNAKILVEDGAELSVLAGNNAPAVGLRSIGGQFLVKNNAKVNLENGNASSAFEAAAATLRFIQAGSYTFIIDHADMTIKKRGGTAPGVRMHGSNNNILVRNKGNFEVINPGNGTANNGGVALGNQAIHYTTGSNNSFTIQDPGSQVTLNAASGPGVDMGTTSGNINVFDGGYFSVSGRTSTAAGGIFNAGVVEINFDNPLYMNFRNNRQGGGNIFNVSNGSILKATNSDLAVWRNGANLDGEPNLNFRKLDYTFGGSNFNTLRETSDPDHLNTTIFGTAGLTTYSRMSSNNGRWAIADELRTPTNADSKIHGRVSLPVGLHDSRPAWDDEAIVTIEVESPSGKKKEYMAKTVGDTNESPGISIYGEEPRGGLFEIDLIEPLEAGSKVRINKVELTSGELTDGFGHQILTETVEVFPIIPPTPAQFSSSIITQSNTTIQGITDNKEAEVTATHNGEPLNTENAMIDNDGKFVIDLREVSLEIDDEIQVFLRDANGAAEAAGVIGPPETNNERGNINPSTKLAFRDVIFEPATTLIVGDFAPVSPVDPLYPEIEVDLENKPSLPEDQGPLSIDFVSSFDFGSQAIAAQDTQYFAHPQRLLNEDGTVNETEKRPNYVQISDRRPENERNGWQLAITQLAQFSTTRNHVLEGAQLLFTNQQLVTAQSGIPPVVEKEDQLTLIPGNKQPLLRAKGTEGTGTWIYRFGDGTFASESVILEVPKGANPEATTYTTTLVWEFSSVPEN